MRGMKTPTVLLVLAFSVACSKDKPKTVTTTPVDRPTPVAQQPKKEAPKDVTGNQQVSQSLAISGDIAAACGIKATNAGSPTFDYDTAELSPEDRAVLDQIGTCLTTGALKGRAVALIGRADPRGTEEYNMGLGSRRSNTVSQYLARLGVGQPQLQSTTRGSLDATGTDEASWQKDRRVDITLAN